MARSVKLHLPYIPSGTPKASIGRVISREPPMQGRTIVKKPKLIGSKMKLKLYEEILDEAVTQLSLLRVSKMLRMISQYV